MDQIFEINYMVQIGFIRPWLYTLQRSEVEIVSVLIDICGDRLKTD